jgi:hypothetical protein
VHRWSGSGLPRDHGRTSCRARATRRYAANDGPRNVDFECFLGSSGTRPLHTVPLQCHPKQCADKHLRLSTARSDTVAFILPSFGRGIFAGSAIFSLLRNHASRVRGCAIRPRAARASKRRSTAIELFCALRKQCARPAMRMTIGCTGDAVHRIVLRFLGMPDRLLLFSQRTFEVLETAK